MSLNIVEHNEFKTLVEINFNNILEGFNKYSYIELSPIDMSKDNVEDYFIKTIEEFYELNDGNLIIDFYKNKLDENSVIEIKNNLSKEDKMLFDDLMTLSNNINTFYKINDKKYIKLFSRLCTRELYFITFYFYKNPITLWGNYNLKFPLFYNENTNLDCYINISKTNKLY